MQTIPIAVPVMVLTNNMLMVITKLIRCEVLWNMSVADKDKSAQYKHDWEEGCRCLGVEYHPYHPQLLGLGDAPRLQPN